MVLAMNYEQTRIDQIYRESENQLTYPDFETHIERNIYQHTELLKISDTNNCCHNMKMQIKTKLNIKINLGTDVIFVKYIHKKGRERQGGGWEE